jgi:hypothetical protein
VDNCPNHPERRAVAPCRECGRRYCSGCLSDAIDYRYCGEAACQRARLREVRQAAGEGFRLGKKQAINPDLKRRMRAFVGASWGLSLITALAGTVGPMWRSTDPSSFAYPLSEFILVVLAWGGAASATGRFRPRARLALLLMLPLWSAVSLWSAVLSGESAGWIQTTALTIGTACTWWFLCRRETREAFRRASTERPDAIPVSHDPGNPLNPGL